ncbi:MAG: helix-turn-helix transcriptional regulator [Coriobacteriales bacterium]|jgi:DNA-binding PadR family transcriptional regulator|nr:helix-turn-helix transcriptional regulator [Coriobacteriales bacterium]
MWQVCSPQSNGELKECAVLGSTLSRLSQPTILTILAASDEPLHGYIIVQRAADSPMFGGKKPDAAGVYRTLKNMEESNLVVSQWETPKAGPAKRMFMLTDNGRTTLRRWIDSLACYQATIEELRVAAATSLGIDLPPTPVCDGH